MFTVEFSHQPKKFLRKCDKSLQARVIDRIELLKSDPVPHKSVRVIKENKTFRIRIGDYRILYEIKWDKKIILIAKIDKRPRVYKRQFSHRKL